MAAIITSDTKIFNARQVKSSFDPSQPAQYLFIGKSTPWTNDAIADAPSDSVINLNDTRRDMFSLKRLTTSDSSLGGLRRNWQSGLFYDFYRHDYGQAGVAGVDLETGTPTAPASALEANFIIITDTFDVYKCMWNANGGVSTVKPTGYSTSEFTTADSYTWKYLYSISPADVLKFVSTDFIPVKTLSANPGSGDFYYEQWLVQSAAIAGRINRAVVTNGGTGYPLSTTFAVTVQGDGTGAVAHASTNGSGNITSVSFTTAGVGYSWANISFGSTGTGAVASVILSPSGGHGSDPISEIGGHYVLLNTTLAYNEGAGDFPQTNEYRRLGLLRDPYIFDTETPATASTLNACYVVHLNIGIVGTFQTDEIITGSISGATSRIVGYDPVTRLMSIQRRNIDSGTFQIGETVTGGTSGATGVVTVVDSPEVDVWSGQILYLEHRLPVSRQIGQQEDIKIVLEC